MLGVYPYLQLGAGRPLVVLAGLMPQAGIWSGLLRRANETSATLWAHERDVFYLNRRPGMPRGITMSEVAAEHAHALRQGFDAPVDVLGVSTGGSIAQQLAADHPGVVRRLVLVSTGCRLGPSAKDVQRRVAARVRGGGRRQAVALFAGDLVPPGPLELAAALAGWLLGPLMIPVSGLNDMATMIEAEDGFDLAELPAITAPTLLIGGGRDRFYGTELFAETAALIPDCHVEIHPRAGHVSVISHPKAVAQTLAFLAAGRPSESVERDHSR
jgi:pimeloyl-ACP methyl ester carboxylesterase